MLQKAPPRFPSGPARERLEALLHLDSDKWMQDWPLEVSDPSRLSEFCDLYESDVIDDDTRFPLMELILYSLEESEHDIAEMDFPGTMVHWIAQLLRQNFPLHMHTVNYWRCPDEPDPENVLPITPLLRRVWEECFSPEYVDALLALFHQESKENPWARYWLMDLIGEARSPALFDFFMHYLYGDEPLLRDGAMWGLKKMGTKVARHALWEAQAYTFPNQKETEDFQRSLSELFVDD